MFDISINIDRKSDSDVVQYIELYIYIQFLSRQCFQHIRFLFFLVFFPWEGGGAGGRGFLIYFLIHEVDVYMYIHYYTTDKIFIYLIYFVCA